MRQNIPIWKRLRKAARLPELYVGHVSGVGIQRYRDIESGRAIPTDPEREALRDLFFGPVKPKPGEDEIRRVLSENVAVVAKRQNVTLTTEQVQSLAAVIGNLVTETLEQAFPEEPTDTAAEENQETAAPEEADRG